MTLAQTTETMPLDYDFLRTLARRADPIGFVSVLVNVDRSDPGDPRPGWDLATRRSLEALAADLSAEGVQGGEAASRLAEASDAIDELLDLRKSGRSRALVLGLGSDLRERVDSDVPLPNEVSFGRVPRLAPLVAAACSSGSAGLLHVSRAGLEALTPNAGSAELILEEPFDEDTDEWRKLVGPAGDSPALARHSASQRDLYSRRVEEHVVQFLVGRSDKVVELATSRDWEALVVAGDPRLAEPVAATLEAKLARSGSQSVVEVTAAGRQWRKNTELRDELDRVLGAMRRSRDEALLEEAREGALSNGRGAIGAADVISSLADGRVEHLLLAPELEVRGSIAADRRLVLADERPPGVDADDLDAEHDLTDELIKRAFNSGADVSTLAESSASRLRDVGGIAARLRW